MPRKIRELIRDLERAGFVNRGGKGSHRKFRHPSGVTVILSGGLGDDADRYQEKEIAAGLQGIENERKRPLS